MKMKTEIILKDGTVYEDKNFDKEKVVELIEKLGTLIDDGSVESISITKSIFTKEIKEKYFDAFEEAVESIRAFFSKESDENFTKEAEGFFGAEMLKLKLEQEEKGREDDREWYRRKIYKLEEELTKMEEDRDSLFAKLTGAEDTIHKLKEENENLACKKANINIIDDMNSRIVSLVIEKRTVIDENTRISEDNLKLYEENEILGKRIDALNEEIKQNNTEYLELEEAMFNAMDSLEEEIEKNNKDLLEQRDTIDRLNRDITNDVSNRKLLVAIIKEQENELDILTNKIDELTDENTGKDSKIKALQLFLTNTNELVDTMSREIARLKQIIKEYSCMVDSYKAKCTTLNKKIGAIKNRGIEIIKECCEEMEDMHRSTLARERDLEKNCDALSSELSSLKNRSLWERIRNKH